MVIQNLVLLLEAPAYLVFFEFKSPTSRNVTQVSTSSTPSAPALPESELFLYTPYSRRRKLSTIINEVRIWRNMSDTSLNIDFMGFMMILS